MHHVLCLAALIPAAVLLIRVYRLDRIEKEPRRLLLRLVLLGAVAALPVAGLQLLLARLLGCVLPRTSMAFLLLDNFLLIACSEELGKLLPVRLAAWKDPAFDYRFDAIVYAVASALGFAAVENVLYVLRSDLRTALSRALLSVPGHFFFAVSMGLLLSRAKQAERSGLVRRGRALRVLSLLVPAALHGFWDFCLAVGSAATVAVFYVYVAAFFTLSVVLLRKASRLDQRL